MNPLQPSRSLPILGLGLILRSCAPAGLASALSLDTSSRRDFLSNAAATAAATAAAANIVANPTAAAAEAEVLSGPASKTICVTGANGYIGLHCVTQLLEAGYSVRAGVRRVTDDKTKYLSKVAADAGASDRLSFAPVDLFSVESMEEAMGGCDALLHLASPFSIGRVRDPVATFVEPAASGAKNAVRAARGLGMRRVVACGSMFGMVGSGAERGYDHVYGSEDVNGFSTPGGCAYAYSKMVAQEESIALAAREGVDLVTLNVGQVCGPALSPDQENPSWASFQQCCKPPPGGATLSCALPVVDVRDVAAAHVAALGLSPSRQPRRYGVFARKESPTYAEIIEIFSTILPERNFPEKVDTLPPSVQNLVIKGIKLADPSLGELVEGFSLPAGKTILVDTDPMLKYLVPKPREVKTTLADWFENQKAYGHAV